MAVKFDPALIPAAPDFKFETTLWEGGMQWVAGIDEAGRGALAGPVSAGVLVFPPDPALAPALLGVRDSKQMTPEERRRWAQRLPALALACAVGFASSVEIDQLGIVPATRLAIRRALEQIPFMPQHLLVDYLQLPECAVPQTPLLKGDQRSLSIAGASILAKHARDDHMRCLDQQYPGYGFNAHKGYGTVVHCDAIRRLGYSPVHRKTFSLGR